MSCIYCRIANEVLGLGGQLVTNCMHGQRGTPFDNVMNLITTETFCIVLSELFCAYVECYFWY